MRIFGVILGVLGVIAGLIATLCLGWYGAVFAILLGAIGLVLGLLSRKKTGKGMGAIIIGAVAVIIAVSMIFSTQNMMTTLKDKLMSELNNEGGKHPTVAKYVEMADTNTGFFGFITSMAAKVSEEDQAAFDEEIKDLTNVLTESSESSGSQATSEPAPAEEPVG